MEEKKILVLCYHKIDQIVNDWNNITVSPQTFDEQMQFLKKNYHLIKSDEPWDNLEEKNIIVTFDDGYEDFYINALPILEKYQIPATVFVTTSTINKEEELWCNELVWLILEGKYYPSFFAYEENEIAFTFKTNTVFNRIKMYKFLKNYLVTVSIDVRNSVLKKLRIWANATSREKRYSHKSLNENQLKELSDNAFITIGAHTVTHPSLAYLPYQEQKEQILGCIQCLQQITGKKVDVFSYPYGGKDSYNEDTVGLLKAFGIKKAMTTDYNYYSLKESLYEIPRVSISQCGLDEFSKEIDSLWNKSKRIEHQNNDSTHIEFIGKIEDDKGLFAPDVRIAIWGCGIRGKRIYRDLLNFNLKNKIICFFDSAPTFTHIDGIPVKSINDYVYNDRLIVIVAIKEVLTIVESVQKYNIRNKHYII